MNIKQKAKHLLTLRKKCADASIITRNLVMNITSTYKLEGNSAPADPDKNKWDACIEMFHDHMEGKEILIRTTYPMESPPTNYYVNRVADRLIIPMKVNGGAPYSARLVFFPQIDEPNDQWELTVSDPELEPTFSSVHYNKYAWGYSLDKIASIASNAGHIDHDLIKPAFVVLGERLKERVAESHSIKR